MYLTNAHLFLIALEGSLDSDFDRGKATGIRALLMVLPKPDIKGSPLEAQYFLIAPAVADSKTSFTLTSALFFKSFTKSNFNVGKNKTFRLFVILSSGLFFEVNKTLESNAETASPNTWIADTIIEMI